MGFGLADDAPKRRYSSGGAFLVGGFTAAAGALLGSIAGGIVGAAKDQRGNYNASPFALSSMELGIHIGAIAGAIIGGGVGSAIYVRSAREDVGAAGSVASK